METKESGAKKVVSLVLNVLLWIVIIIAAFFIITTLSTKSEQGYSSIFGIIPMPVLTESMDGDQPDSFAAGDLIFVRESKDNTNLKVGDIITFRTIIEGQGALNTHRIVKVTPSEVSPSYTRYTTKGDNNEQNDLSEVAPGDIIGVLAFSVPFVGTIMTFLSSSVGFLVIIVLPLLAFFIFQVYKFISLLIEARKVTAQEAAQSERDKIEAEVRAKLEAEIAAKNNKPAADSTPSDGDKQ